MRLPPTLRPLATMRAALLILAALAVASVAGTFVTQQLTTTDYELIYGPFWTQVFALLGLFDVYRAPWFVALLGVLMLSVSACLLTNGPAMWRQLQTPKRAPSATALRSWTQLQAPKNIVELLKTQGFRLKKEYETGQLYSQGSLNRVGYYLTHAGIVLLCVAGLLTAFVGWQGLVVLREGDMSATAISIGANSRTERELPFRLTNTDFNVLHFENGMPSAYQTELEIEHQNTTTNATLNVNHPLRVADHRIYQTSFGDGASTVSVTVIDLLTNSRDNGLSGQVYQTLNHQSGASAELTDLRATTVESVLQAAQQNVPDFRDFGPSLDYTLTIPERGAVLLRSYQNVPNLIALADPSTDPVTDPAYAPLYLGLRLDEPHGWPTLAAMLQEYANQPQDLTVLLQNHAALELQALPERERLDLAFKILQAAQIATSYDLRYLLWLEDFEQQFYSALMVRYDPGATLFWIAGVMLALGVLLMVYFHYRRVWVIGEQIFIRSNRGRGDAKKIIQQLKIVIYK